MRNVKLEQEFEEAKSNYVALRKKQVEAEKALVEARKDGKDIKQLKTMQVALDELTKEQEAKLKEVDALRDQVDNCTILPPQNETTKEMTGEIKELKVKKYDKVEKGQEVIIINPKDHFYLFNKSLAIVSFLGFIVFLTIHLLAL